MNFVCRLIKPNKYFPLDINTKIKAKSNIFSLFNIYANKCFRKIVASASFNKPQIPIHLQLIVVFSRIRRIKDDPLKFV